MSVHRRYFRTGSARTGPAVFALAVALAALLALPGRDALGDEVALENFENLYNDGLSVDGASGKGPALGALDLSLGTDFDGLTPDIEMPEPALVPDVAPPARAADRKASQGTWQVVPMLPKRNSDEDMTLLQELTPMGLGFVHSF